MPGISPESPRFLVIDPSSSGPQATGNAEQPQPLDAELEVRPGVVSNNIQAQAQVRPGLAPSAAARSLQAASSPPETGSFGRGRALTAMGLADFTRARSPSSRSAPRNLPNQPPIVNPRVNTFIHQGLVEPQHATPGRFEDWPEETKVAGLRQSVSTVSTPLTASTASISSPSGSPISRSGSTLGSPLGGDATSPSNSPSSRLDVPGRKDGKAIGMSRSASALQMPVPKARSDMEKVDIILRNQEMRTEAEAILEKLFAREVMPFIKAYGDFASAKNDSERGKAFEAIFKAHLQTGSQYELNLSAEQMDALRVFGPTPGPIASNSTLAGLLAEAFADVKQLMVNNLNVQGQSEASARAKSLLAKAASMPVHAERASQSGIRSFLSRLSPFGNSPSTSSSSSSISPSSSSDSGSGSSPASRKPS